MANLTTKIPDLTLPNGDKIPMLGFGVGTAWYKPDAKAPLDDKTTKAVEMAIKMGYTHIDGAEVYNTEPEMAAAIKASGIPRSSLYLTSKVIRDIADIPAALDASLAKLNTDHVDLYLIHAPFFADPKASADPAKIDTKLIQSKWKDMEAALAAGKTKAIGVSNFLQPHLDAILETCEVRPAINQIEFHPYLQHGNLLAYHKSKDIKLAAYAPLTPVTKAPNGPLTPYLEELAKKYAVNPSEILLRWCIDMGVVAVTTSGKEQRLSDYLRCCAFELNPKEVEKITEIGKDYHHRVFWNEKFDKEDKR